MAWRVGFGKFSIDIDNKTNFVALSAFMLSLSGIIFQIVILAIVFFRGPEVTLFQPDQILFVPHLFEPGKEYMQVDARMAYTNAGATGYDAVVADEFVTLDLGTEGKFKQKWGSFRYFEIDDGGKLKETNDEPANPFLVNAGSAASHDTYFQPYRNPCKPNDTGCKEWSNYLTWNDFLKKIKNIKEIKVTVSAVLYGYPPPDPKICTVSIDKNAVDRLKKNRWYSASCRPDS